MRRVPHDTRHDSGRVPHEEQWADMVAVLRAAAPTILSPLVAALRECRARPTHIESGRDCDTETLRLRAVTDAAIRAAGFDPETGSGRG